GTAKAAKFLELSGPRLNYLFRILGTLDSFQGISIHQQTQIVIHFPIQWIQTTQRHCDLHSHQQRTKLCSISDHDIYATTKFVLEHRGVWSELDRNKSDSWNHSSI